MSLPFYLQHPRPGPCWYNQVPSLALDLETTNKDYGDPRNVENRIVMACLNGQVYPDMPAVLDQYDRAVLVAHNAKFELGWMHRYGIDLSKFLVWDTMIAEYVLAGNRQWPLDLDSVCKRYGLPAKDPVVDSMMKAGVCPSEIPEDWLKARVIRDTKSVQKLMFEQYKLLQEKGLLEVMFTRCIVTPVLAVIESNGMRVDNHRVWQEQTRQATAQAAADKALKEIAGGINLRSRPQLAEFLYDKLGFEELTGKDGEPLRTKTGLRATDADSLDKLKAKTPEQKEFLKLIEQKSHADSRLSKAINCFMLAINGHQSLLLGQFNQCVTQTHRLSSSAKRLKNADGKEYGVQFQNMPREYKRLFRPHEREGRYITEFDYSQLEFKVAVELAGDTQGMEDIRSGHDVHKFTASVLRNKPVEEVTKDERQDAKPDTFKPLYYGQSGTPAQRRYYAAFRERYPQIAAMQEKWIAEAVRTGQQRTASGLIYYWPEARPDRKGYVHGSPSICNYPIQAFATADIVLVGLVHTFWRLQDLDAMIVNTVHDSIVVDHSCDDTLEVIKAAKQGMILDTVDYIRLVYKWEIKVPLTGEYITSSFWGDPDTKAYNGGI